MALGFHRQALFTACKLKVFDVLKDEAPLKAMDVARRIDASERGTGWLLDVCVALGLLDKTERGKGMRTLSGKTEATHGGEVASEQRQGGPDGLSPCPREDDTSSEGDKQRTDGRKKTEVVLYTCVKGATYGLWSQRGWIGQGSPEKQDQEDICVCATQVFVFTYLFR